MSVQTLDIEQLKFKTGNKYELLVILSKRARQIAAQEKLELDEKLQYFEGFEEEDEFSFNEEQENISKAFEKLPHATQRSIVEMQNDQIYYRHPEKEED
ncbi:MAG: DNA-directed RNA polymerase subunit omega [Balneolaceae bacterium]